jgi:hypothetical protein
MIPERRTPMRAVALMVFSVVVLIGASPAGADSGKDATVLALRQEDGSLKPVSEPSRLHDSDWLKVEYSGEPKKRVPVQLVVEIAVPEVNETAVKSMFTDAVMGTHRVRVFDSTVGRSTPRSKYTLNIKVTECELKKKGHGIGGLGSGLLGSATGGLVNGATFDQHKAEMSVAVTLLSSRTGEVLRSGPMRGKCGGLRVGMSGVNVPGLGPADVESWSSPSMAAAARVVAAKVAYQLSEWLVDLEGLGR